MESILTSSGSSQGSSSVESFFTSSSSSQGSISVKSFLTSSSSSQGSFPSSSSSSAIADVSALIKRRENNIAEISIQEAADDELLQPRKAERETIETILRWARASETSNNKQLMQRTGTEELLANAKGELETVKKHRDKIMEELWIVRDQKTALEEESGKAIKELKEKHSSAIEMMKKYKEERDELQRKFDKSLEVAEDLRCVTMPRVFSLADIREATRNFDQSMKIGEGGFGSIYKASLYRAQVAVKMMNPYGSQGQGPSEFRQEVEILSKLRHPNIITLIGTCPERCALIYEYMPNGSLEDRLASLPWKTRIHIATELCSTLHFLHSQGIVHGDIKPSNILLGNDFISKLSDFGISRIISKSEVSRNNTTLFHLTNAKGTPAYMDPDFHCYGELTLKSDVYPFGILLLQLLTGKRPAIQERESFQERESLGEVLDTKAGEWPLVQAGEWFELALRCSHRERSERCDIGVALKVLQDTMRVL